MNDHHTYNWSRTREFIPNVLTLSFKFVAKAQNTVRLPANVYTNTEHTYGIGLLALRRILIEIKTHISLILYSVDNVSYYEDARTQSGLAWYLPKNKWHMNKLRNLTLDRYLGVLIPHTFTYLFYLFFSS